MCQRVSTEYTEDASAFQAPANWTIWHEAVGEEPAKAARRCCSQSGACARGGESGFRCRRRGGQPRSRRARSRRRHRHALPAFPHARSLVRGGVPPRGATTCRSGRTVETRGAARRRTAPWLRSNVQFVATKKGMSAALALAAYKNSELFSYSFDRLTRAVGGLLDRAIAAGEIRDDISPEDVLRALVGMCYMHDQPGWQTSVLRLVDVFIDGLRLQPDRPRSKAKRRKTS